MHKCITSFANASGVTQAGTIVANGDVRLETNPDAFEPVRADVESATAAPGEVRSTPAKKTAAKKG